MLQNTRDLCANVDCCDSFNSSGCSNLICDVSLFNLYGFKSKFRCLFLKWF